MSPEDREFVEECENWIANLQKFGWKNPKNINDRIRLIAIIRKQEKALERVMTEVKRNTDKAFSEHCESKVSEILKE